MIGDWRFPIADYVPELAPVEVEIGNRKSAI